MLLSHFLAPRSETFCCIKTFTPTTDTRGETSHSSLTAPSPYVQKSMLSFQLPKASTPMRSLRIIQSERDIRRSVAQPPAQSRVRQKVRPVCSWFQAGLDNLQGWRQHSLSANLLYCSVVPVGKKILKIHSEPLYFQLIPVVSPSCQVLLWRAWLCLQITSVGASSWCKVPLKPSRGWPSPSLEAFFSQGKCSSHQPPWWHLLNSLQFVGAFPVPQGHRSRCSWTWYNQSWAEGDNPCPPMAPRP